MSDDFYDEDRDADLLGDMAAATFHAPPEIWGRIAAELDESQLEQLRAGELSIVTMDDNGVERTPLVAPAWMHPPARGDGPIS